MQNACHDWSASHMKYHLQCAEQAKLSSNLTKYCACHEIFKFKIGVKTSWHAFAKKQTIRWHSDGNTTTKSSSRTRRFGDLPRPILETILYWKKYSISRSGYLRKCHENAAPATKSHSPPSQNTAPATKIQTPPSPLTAAATKNAFYCFLHLYSFLAFIFSGHLLSLGIYSLNIYSLRIYSTIAA